jgi:hypothetical protein
VVDDHVEMHLLRHPWLGHSGGVSLPDGRRCNDRIPRGLQPQSEETSTFQSNIAP